MTGNIDQVEVRRCSGEVLVGGREGADRAGDLRAGNVEIDV
jgi:hypothetical protein